MLDSNFFLLISSLFFIFLVHSTVYLYESGVIKLLLLSFRHATLLFLYVKMVKAAAVAAAPT